VKCKIEKNEQEEGSSDLSDNSVPELNSGGVFNAPPSTPGIIQDLFQAPPNHTPLDLVPLKQPHGCGALVFEGSKGHMLN